LSVDISLKKQKALEPKTSKKTKSSRAKNAVFGIDENSNQDIKEDRKKASRYEKEILDLLIGGKTNVLSNQLRSSGFLSQLGGHLGMACAWRARIDTAGTNFDLYVAE